MRVYDRFISVNGLRLHYVEWGDSAAPPLVLLHGGSAHAHWWDLFAEAVADAYRVLALDLRGHGNSEHPVPPSYGIGDYTHDLSAVVEALGLPRFDLVGHSLGGLVATAYAHVRPERLNALVIVDTQLRISAAGARYMVRLRNFPQPVYRDRDEAIRRFRLLPMQTEADPKLLARIATHAVRELPDGSWTLKFDREALAHNGAQDLTPILGRLRCPILLVRGAHSSLLSHAALGALRAAAPHAEAAEIPDAHHHVMLDNPAAFCRVVRAFLERHRSQSGNFGDTSATSLWVPPSQGGGTQP